MSNANTGMGAENTVVTQCALHHFQYTSQTTQPYFAPQGQAPSTLPLPAADAAAE
tara:strand:- start:2004 stop:2168 length:165 start_codon:yes stop_codon:yes gene_type:complete